MARFGIKSKSRRKAAVGGFHAEYLNDRTAIRQRKQLGLLRSLFSGLALLFGGGMIYVAMHYIPAFVQPKQILKFASGDSAAHKTYDFDRKSKAHDIFGPYIKLFPLDRAYMKPGQTIMIKYDLPEGAYANLEITQCRRAWVVEVFDCEVVSSFKARTKRRSGVESYALKQGGFYHFKQAVVGVPKNPPRMTGRASNSNTAKAP